MRVDLYLVNNSYVESREKAKRLIKNGKIVIDGRISEKVSENIDENINHAVVVNDNEKYVSRGGYKLESALKSFDIDVANFTCIDVGSSTGGFSDCLLKSGACKIYAFDSGKGQLHSTLKDDDRIVLKEGFNARFLSSEQVPEKADIAVMDVSFISQTLIIPAIVPLLKEKGTLVTLVKPQFESGRQALSKNGIVKKASDRYSAAVKVFECGKMLGLFCLGFIKSPIKGGDGNEEFLIYFSKDKGVTDEITLDYIKKTVYEN